MYEDRAGNFWVGTRHGLDKLDRAMGTFTHCLADSISGQVRSIYEDGEGNVWVGTSRGLDKYDHSSGTFTHYVPDPDHLGLQRDGEAESSNVVLAIEEDKDGSLWIGSGDGLYIFDRTAQIFKTFRHDDQDPGSLAHNSINAIYKDRTGRLWFGTDRGLDGFDRETSKFIHYWHCPDNVHGAPFAPAYWVTSIYQDRSGTLWLATRGGLVAFDQRTGLCVQYIHKPNDPGSYSGGPVTSICEDEEGILWVGTSGGGLNAFDRRSGKFSHYVHDERDPGSLTAGDILCIYPERSGSLWITTYVEWWGGVNKLNRTKPLFAHYVGTEGKQGSLSSSEIAYVFEDTKGTIWISTTKGLEKFDPKTEKFVQQEPHEPVWAIAEDRMGNLWIAGQHGGVYKRDQRGNATRFRDSLRHEFQPVVVSICQVHDGTLWLGTRAGLFQLDPVTNKVRKIGPSEPLNGVHEDAAGLLWIGTTNYGLLCYDPSRDSTVRYASDPQNPATPTMNTIITIHEDKAGTLWLGTGLGLNRYDRSTGTFSHFTTKDGLPFDVVMGSVEDDHGNLWLGTGKGISKFNPNTKGFKNYDVSYGLAGNDIVTFCRARNGELYFGGRQGLTRFQPDSVRDNPFVPPVVITSFRIFNQPVPLGKEIRLSYNENFLSFEFVALSYVSSEKNRYAYMMEGLDKEWVNSGTRRYASYPHLDPGDYVFRVKGSNNDGVWNKQGTSIAVIITPPFWSTWWFRGFAFIVMLVSVGGSIRYIEMKKVKRRIERLENERALERERARISQDMHDEVGASLTEIAILSELARKEMGDRSDIADSHIRRIADQSREVVDSMGQIIWTINPKNDRLNDLVAYLHHYAMLFLKSTAIRCRFESPEPVPDFSLSAEVRRHIFLVVKEALHNVVKHSHATEATVRCGFGEGKIKVSVEDNGAGFPVEQVSRFGNGVLNMRKRIEAIGGTFTIDSQQGGGTKVCIAVPIAISKR